MINTDKKLDAKLPGEFIYVCQNAYYFFLGAEFVLLLTEYSTFRMAGGKLIVSC